MDREAKIKWLREDLWAAIQSKRNANGWAANIYWSNIVKQKERELQAISNQR